MKKICLVILCIISFNASYSQTVKEDTKITKKTKTLKLSSINLSEKTMGELKDELIAWDEKVKSIDINEKTKEFTLIHYMTMDNRELFDVLNKYNIQKNAIISYQ